MDRRAGNLASPRRIAPSARARTALLALVTLLALVAAACGPSPSPRPSAASPAPSATASSTAADDAAIYREIAGQVVAIRGLDAPEHVEPTIIDRATLEARVAEQFTKDNPPEVIDRAERIYKALGLLHADASLTDLYVALQGSQVIGFYDPSSKELVIVSHDGGLGPVERLTYAHEFTHELQDVAFDLQSLGLDQLQDQSDRGLALLGLVEGDAVSAQTTWMTGNLTAAELTQVALEAADPAILEVMAKTPAILLETSLFPYQDGAAFIAGLLGAGGYPAVNAAYADPPASTEQVLHPEKYAAHETPVVLAFPADLAARFGPGATLDALDTLGELQLRVWLKQLGVPGEQARAAASGWGGDRVALVHAGGGDALALSTAWDSRADAVEFRAAAATALDALKLSVGISGIVVGPDGSSRVAILIGGSLGTVGTSALLTDIAGSR